MTLTKLEVMKRRIWAVELLRLVRDVLGLTYADLGDLLGQPATVMSRYYLGHVVPGLDRAMQYIKILEKKAKDAVVEALDSGGGVTTALFIAHPILRKLWAYWAAMKLEGTRVNAIVAPAADGIPLATTLSDIIGAPVLVAKEHKESGVVEHLVVEVKWLSGYIQSLFIPLSPPFPRKVLKRRNKPWMVVVDDIALTGTTVRSIARGLMLYGIKVPAILLGVAKEGVLQDIKEDGVDVHSFVVLRD